MSEELVHLWRAAIGVAEAAPLPELFLAMVLLPLAGVPVSPFWIAAGIRLGPGAAMLASTIALVLNMALGYWLAHGTLRIPLLRWMTKHGYSAPRLEGLSEAQFIVMIRVAPPLPLAVQNYLLALAGVRLLPYLLLSVPVQAAYALAFIWFGHTLTGHDLWRVIVGVAMLVATLLAMNLVRTTIRSRMRGKGSSPG